LKLRSRILAASGVLILVPLLVLAFGMRSEMRRRLTEQYTARVQALMDIIVADLADTGGDVAARLHALKREIADDNRFRLAAVDGHADQRPYLLDYAGNAMTLMGLKMLQIQDRSGRILSSGHYRNEFDRLEPTLPRLLGRTVDGSALVSARRPEGPFLALATLDSLWLAGERYDLIGGIEVNAAFLDAMTHDRELAVSIVYSGGAISTDPGLQARLTGIGLAGLQRPELNLGRRDYFVLARDLPFIPPSFAPQRRLESARIIVTHPVAPLQALLRSLYLWLALALLATLAGSLILAFWLSARISRPLAELARQTAGLDLDRLEADFATDRKDEVGTLSRFLAAMTDRLRLGVIRLREAERRATLGELARQVNHDIRNGLTPIRNVLKHLTEIAAERPDRLADVFLERRQTLDAGLAYLEDLATHYARLSPRQRRQSCDLNRSVREALTDLPADPQVSVVLNLDASVPAVWADPIGLRRILENLLRNAQESFQDRKGILTISTWPGASPPPQGKESDGPSPGDVILTVADTGCGIPLEIQDRIFADFFTTKSHGTGLGLSIVRRLVSDCEGSIRVESRPGQGTTFTIVFPAAENGEPSGGGDAAYSQTDERRDPTR
jgi:signal transduction histidine kinase